MFDICFCLLLYSYRENATRVSNSLKDQLVPSKDLAIYWVEHVLRHGGTKHLQSSAKEMPFYQIYLIDIWLFLAFILVTLLYVNIKIGSWITRKCFRMRSKVKNQ